jgi:hypothetical protein
MLLCSVFSYRFFACVDDDLLENIPKMSRLPEACEDFGNIIRSSHEAVVYKGTMKDGWRSLSILVQ